GDVADLGDAVHDLGDLAAELALDVGDGDGRVLHHVVHQAARHRDGVQVQPGEDLGDLHAVQHVVVAGGALLAPVRVATELIGARQQVGVEPLHERVVAEVPPRDQLLQCRCCHNSPVSAKLTYRSLPTTT